MNVFLKENEKDIVIRDKKNFLFYIYVNYELSFKSKILKKK